MRSYAAQGYDLSLRQLYYQFVAHHGLDNTEQNYKMLGVVVSDARLAGLLDWDSLVDRGRSTIVNSHWETPADIIDSAAASFRLDLWETQDCHVEVMVEKQALEGVLVPVCRRLDVPFTANKGYSSSSAMYEAGKRLEQKMDEGKRIVIVYLGDHDPSGIDMGRDVFDRLALFSGAGYWDSAERVVEARNDGTFVVNRIALNMDQIRQYNPPPNPAKMTDSRAKGYVSKYGYESWELDALDPDTLAGLVASEVERHIDPAKWDERVSLLEKGRADLRAMAKTYRLSMEDTNA
jgi:hypothetical protein